MAGSFQVLPQRFRLIDAQRHGLAVGPGNGDGGELVLETLIIDGGPNEVLVPGERYAQMRNVWFIPSAAALVGWLEKCGFENVRIVDQSLTTTDEQRRTPWMRNDSLAEFLDPTDPTLTIEGHPAPKRAVLVASRRAEG